MNENPQSPEAGPDTSPQRSERNGSGLFNIGTVVCLVLAVVFLLIPIRRRLEARRVNASVEKVSELVSMERFDEAFHHLRPGLKGSPLDPQVQRLTAAILANQRDARCLSIYKALIASKQGTREDRSKYINTALDLNKPDLVSGELEALETLEPKWPETLLLRVRFELQRGNLTNALALAQRWLNDAPADPSAQYGLGLVQSVHPNSAVRSEGRRNLLGLASGNSAMRDPAIDRLLLQPSTFSRAEAQLLLRLIESRPGNTTSDLLRVAELKWFLDPRTRSETVASIVAQGTQADGSQLLRLANWLEAHGELEAVPLVLPMERSRTNAAFLMARLQTLAWLSKLAEVEPHLADMSLPLEPLQRNVLRASLEGRRKPPGDALTPLKEALKVAGTNNTVRVEIANHAVRLGLTGLAMDIYSQLLPEPGLEAEASLELLRLIDTITPTQVARDKVKGLSARFPTVRILAVEAHYLNLLLRENLIETRAALKDLVTATPDVSRLRWTMALADFYQDKPKDALVWFGKDLTLWARSAPRWIALRAAILAATGDSEGARKIVRDLDMSKLRPEEQAWLKNLRP